jgi:dipeptidyl-peptidase-3
VNDYAKLRTLFGDLLREMQRITSEGDFEAAKKLVETYGVKVDAKLHAEVLARSEKLNIPPYNGFVNPIMTPVMKDGKMVDVEITFPTDFLGQMLYYGEQHSFLN